MTRSLLNFIFGESETPSENQNVVTGVQKLLGTKKEDPDKVNIYLVVNDEVKYPTPTIYLKFNGKQRHVMIYDENDEQKTTFCDGDFEVSNIYLPKRSTMQIIDKVQKTMPKKITWRQS